MFNRLTTALRSDRGDVGIYSTILGAVLFLFATMMVSGFLVLGLGASALAQANTELVGTFRSELQMWEKSSWADLENERLKGTASTIGKVQGPETVTAGGREYKVHTLTTFNPTNLSYKMTKVSQRAVTPGQAAIDCLPQLHGTKVPSCLAVSGTIAATPDDVKPEPPAGVLVPTLFTVTSPGGGLLDYIKVADLDRLKITGNQLLRISYVNAAGGGAGDMNVGLFCTDSDGALSISEAPMSFDEPTGAYYAKVGLADFDRLEMCVTPNLRISSAGGELPDPETVQSTLIVLKALAGTGSGGKE